MCWQWKSQTCWQRQQQQQQASRQLQWQLRLLHYSHSQVQQQQQAQCLFNQLLNSNQALWLRPMRLLEQTRQQQQQGSRQKGPLSCRCCSTAALAVCCVSTGLCTIHCCSWKVRASASWSVT
jgi:DNA-directed RNA polymerase specialized sigma54-like protein